MSISTVQKQKGFLERAAWLTGANFLAFALSFLAPLIIVRVFSQSEFGTYKQLFQILTTVMMVLYLQIPSSSYYFMPREPERRLQVAMNIILFYVLAGSVMAVVFAAFPHWITYIFHNPALDQYVPLLGLALTLWLIGANVEVLPLAMEDFRTASAFIVLSQISKSLILLGAALIFGDLKAVLWASIIQGGIQCALMLGYIHRNIGSLMIRPDRLFDLALMKKQLSNSLPYGGGSTLQGIQSDLHNYFVSYYFSAAAFAVYANGCFQMPLLSLLQQSFRDALTPEVARLEAAGDYKGIIHTWLNAMRKLSFVVLPACALMFVLRYELITTLFTTAYADSVPIFSIFLIYMLSQMVLTNSIMRTIADFRFFRVKLNVILIPLAIAALYVGIKLAGMIGAVTATVCVYLLDITACVAAICVRLEVKRGDVKQLAPVTRTVAAVIIATMAAYAIKAMLGSAHSIVILAVCAMVFGAIYVIAAFAFGALTPDEKAELYIRSRNLGQKFISRAARKIASAFAR
ncbi:MAG: lipopolysaccharide biosynthesis protein [Blastocatellales bacterium]